MRVWGSKWGKLGKVISYQWSVIRTLFNRHLICALPRWRSMRIKTRSCPARLKGLAAFSAIFILVVAAERPCFAAELVKPNVIFIMADDQGSVDAGCYGSKDLVTPAMDSLAEKGVRFTQFYSAAPVCSASRAGMLTGRYPWLAGMPSGGGR